jgi:DNA-binding transcriptional MerR regulator
VPQLPTIHLTTNQIIDAVQRLDGEALIPRTLSLWAKLGIVAPSVRHDGQRGRYHPRLYNLSDLARVRLVVQLRRRGVSMGHVRIMLAYVDAQLRDVWHPKSGASLIVHGFRAYVAGPGRPTQELGTGQLRLKLEDVWRGTRSAAEEIIRSA